MSEQVSLHEVAASAAQNKPERLLTWRSGGWVLLLAVLLSLAIVVWRITVILHTLSIPVIGDGQHVATYGFDLSTCLVPRGQIVAAGFPRDGLPVMDNPKHLTIDGANDLGQQMMDQHLGRFMVTHQPVIGITINGQSRAYPLKILAWHEVVNDSLGDTPIVVTYNPLCNSVAVFDRRVNGETISFGVSGLLYNSNLLLYDRHGDDEPLSLWSQLQMRAVSGPAAESGATLKALPCAVMRWQDWEELHPDTTVLAPDMNRIAIYKRTYAEYFGTDELRFPVEPLPERDRPYKSQVIAVLVSGEWHAFLWDLVAREAGESGVWSTEVAGVPLTFRYQADIALRGNPAAVWARGRAGASAAADGV